MKNKRKKRKPIAKHLKYATSLDTLWGDIDIFQADIKLIFSFRANTPQTMTYNTLQYMPFSKIEKTYGKHGITRYEAPQHGTFLEAWHPSTIRCLILGETSTETVWNEYLRGQNYPEDHLDIPIGERIVNLSLSSFLRVIAASTDRGEELRKYMDATSPKTVHELMKEHF